MMTPGVLKIQEEARSAIAKKMNRKTKLFCLRLPAADFERIKASKRPDESCGAYVLAAIRQYLPVAK